MRGRISPCSMIVSLAACAVAGHAYAAPPDLSGNYRCEPQPRPCELGASFSVTQSGTKLEFKNEKGDQGSAQLTSDITLSAAGPWNMLGVVYDRSIEWSNGTKWRKE